MRALLPALILAVAVASPALAQSLEEARRSYLNADFRVAAEQFDAVLATPTVDRAAAVEAHRHLAALQMLLGDDDAARRHAEAAVAFDPAAAAPEGAPPALEEVLAAARESFGGRAAAIGIELAEGASGATVRATVTPAPEALAERIGLRCVRGAASVEETAALPSVTAAVPSGETGAVHCRAWIAGRGGAHLIESSAQLRATPAVAAPAGSFGEGGGSGAVVDPVLGVGGDDGEDDGGGGVPWLAIGVGAGAVALAVVLVLVLTSSGGDGARLGAPRAEGW